MLFLLLIAGCNEDKTENFVYVKVIKDMSLAWLYKRVDRELFRVEIKREDLKIIIDDLKNISAIKEYSADAAPFGGFKEGFKSIMIYNENQKRNIALLYSIDEKAMIIRKCDIFLGEGIDLPLITVYEFELSKRVVQILKKYEEQIPDGGYFYSSWPSDYPIE